MGGWIELEKERYLSVNKMNSVYDDFCFLAELLKEKGYEVGEISDNSAYYTSHPGGILEKMNTAESNIRTIDTAADWVNPYFLDFTWEHITYDKKKQVDRWIDFLNFAYGVLNGTLGGPQYLLDSDGNYITDQDGNYILVYKEFLNG